jgi:surface protein
MFSLLLFLTMNIGTQGFDKLPNGDGIWHLNSGTGNAGTLRRAVSDWIAGGASKSTVVATYGPIEDWDVSEVTNMKNVFYDKSTFNADLSKWNMGKVTDMAYSKCTLSCVKLLCGHAFRCCVF